MSTAMQPMEAVRLCMATSIRRRICHINKAALEALRYLVASTLPDDGSQRLPFVGAAEDASLSSNALVHAHASPPILRGGTPERHKGRMLEGRRERNALGPDQLDHPLIPHALQIAE